MANPAETHINQWLGPTSRDDFSSDLDLPPESGFTASLYHLCLLQLSRLVHSIVPLPNPGCKRRAEEIRWRLVVFGDWFEDGKLESCINLDDELRDIVLGLLYDIGKILTQDFVLAHLRMNKINFDPLEEHRTQLLNQHLEQASVILGLENCESDDADSDNSEDDLQSSASDATTYFKPTYLDSLAANVNLLMDLCPALELICRQKSYVNQARTHQAQHKISASTGADNYSNIIRDRFPLADRSLVNRLGEANWERHIRLRAIDLLPYFFRKELWSWSQRTYQGTRVAKICKLWRKVSVSILQETNLEDQYTDDWKMHVFADLQPYICTFKDCSAMMATYSTRKAWFDHETAHHLSQRSLQCRLCTEKFDDPNAFLLHAGDDHDVSLTNLSIRSAVLSTATTVVLNPVAGLNCPLCPQKEFSSYRNYATHVGHHLEEIALRALPPNDDADDEVEVDRKDSSGSSDMLTRDQIPLSPVRIIVLMNGIPFGLSATIDTEADVNVMSEEQVKALGWLWPFEKSDEHPISLGGHDIYPLGTIFVNMRLELQRSYQRVQFFVVRDSDLSDQGVVLNASFVAKFGHLPGSQGPEQMKLPFLP